MSPDLTLPWRQGGRLSFLSALTAVMEVMAAGTSGTSPPVPVQERGGKPGVRVIYRICGFNGNP